MSTLLTQESIQDYERARQRIAVIEAICERYRLARDPAALARIQRQQQHEREQLEQQAKIIAATRPQPQERRGFFKRVFRRRQSR